MKVILTCKDREDPKDEKEADILAAANLYAGRTSLQTRSTKIWETVAIESSASSTVHEPAVVREEDTSLEFAERVIKTSV